jgi:Fe2+ transport system protein FeoA
MWRRRWGWWRPPPPPIRGEKGVIPLVIAPTGSRVRVVDIRAPPMAYDRIIAMGIVRGASLEIIKNNNLDYGMGPIIVRVSGTEFAVGRGLASYILVEISPEDKG